MAKRRNYEDLGDIELSPEDAARAESAVDRAERDLARAEEVRVNFRWGSRQLDLVRKAADLSGVPYQSYLKQAAIKQAMSDLKDAAGLREAGYGDDERPEGGPRLVSSGG